MGSRPMTGRWAPAYALLVEYGELYLYVPVTQPTTVKALKQKAWAITQYLQWERVGCPQEAQPQQTD